MFFQLLVASDPSFTEQRQPSYFAHHTGLTMQKISSELNDLCASLSDEIPITQEEWGDYMDFSVEEISGEDEDSEITRHLNQREAEANELLRRIGIFLQHLPEELRSDIQENFTPGITTLRKIQLGTQGMKKAQAIPQTMKQVFDDFTPYIESLDINPKTEKAESFCPELQKIKTTYEDEPTQIIISLGELGELSCPSFLVR